MTSTEQVLAAAAERRRTPLVRAAQCLAFMKSMRGDMSDTGDLSDTVFVDLSDPLKARHAIFISYSRRDPGALNAGYAFISAWRHGLGPEGRPFCAATYLDGEVPPRCALWTDKEQMAESGGDDWSLILTKAQIRSLLSVYLLGNAYIGSAECTKEFQFGDMKGITFIPIFLERLAQSEAEFEAGKPRWRPDRSRSFYEQWSGYRDVLDRLAGPK